MLVAAPRRQNYVGAGNPAKPPSNRDWHGFCTHARNGVRTRTTDDIGSKEMEYVRRHPRPPGLVASASLRRRLLPAGAQQATEDWQTIDELTAMVANALTATPIDRRIKLALS